MEEKKTPPDQARRNNEREGRIPPYQQLAADMAQPLAELQVPGTNDERNAHREGRSGVEGRTENAMPDTRQEPRKQAQERNQRQRSVPVYQQVAAEMARPLAELQVPGDSNESTVQQDAIGRTSVDGRTENAMGTRQEPREQAETRNRRQKRVPPYRQLAADMAEPLAELQVSGANNDNHEAVTSVDGRTENETESCQGASLGSKLEVPTKKKQARKHYLELAGDISGQLAELRVPVTSEDRDLQREAGMQTQRQTTESVPYQESLSEYNPDAMCGSGSGYETCGHSSVHSGEEMRTESASEQQWSSCSQNEPTKSVPCQESLSEYNPDATCGSRYEYESCSYSAEYSGEEFGTGLGNREQWSLPSQTEPTKSFPHQESLSEYNPDAACGSMAEYESCGSFEGGNMESSGTEGFPSRLPVETEINYDACMKEAHLDSCYSQPDGEPSSKRTKPNPEVTETRSVGDVEFTPRPGSGPQMSSVESAHFESFGKAEDQESVSQISGVHSTARNTECLSSEFEHMNLQDNNSVETSVVSNPSITFQSNQGADFRESTQETSKDFQDGSERFDEVSYSTYIDSSTHSQSSTQVYGNEDISSRASGENVSMASAYSQGARPKTSEKVPKRKKHKIPKPNTKNAYGELAKEVAVDFSAMNRQLGSANTRNHRAANEGRVARDQVLFDGSTVQAEKEKTSSLHSSPPKREQRDTRQQPSLTNDDRVGRRNVRDRTENTSMSKDAKQTDDSNTHASTRETRITSRRTRETPAAAEYRRAELEEQQKLIDNMGPELQALVIEMIQRDEEELGGGHVLHTVHFNPPVPPREQNWGRGESSNQGANAQGALQQSVGKKAGKGKKKKGHYVELASIIAPELAKVNTALMNGHREEPGQSDERGRTEENGGNGTSQGAVGHDGTTAMITNGACGTDLHSPGEQLVSGVSTRDQSRARTSLPQPAAGRRQRRGNGNRNHGGSADSTGRGPGKENRGQSRKQKKSKEDENKSSLSQMAESMAASLQDLNARLEEQQRQQRVSMNGAAGNSLEERTNESRTHDTSVVTDESMPSRSPAEHGHK